MRFIVDRIEGELAVCECEDGSYTDILLSQLPSQIKEGSVLEFINGEYKINLEAQQNRTALISALQDSIFDE